MKNYRIVVPISIDDEDGGIIPTADDIAADIDSAVDAAVDKKRSNVVTGESWVLEGP